MNALATEPANRRALVTGGNRGIGLEVCRQLTQLGYAVLLGSRDPGRGAAAAHSVGATAVPLDVADPTAAGRLAAEIGPIDVLIVREAFEVNMFSAWRTAQAFAPMMRDRRWGRIVKVSSEAGSLVSMAGGTPAYSTSKAALNALTRVLAGDLQGSGVLVNAVCPGWVATDMGGAGGRAVAEGAASVIWAATLPDDGPTGGSFRDGHVLPW